MRGLGGWGESHAARFLKTHGLKIIAENFKTRWGEIDLVAREGETWVFIEVKTRRLKSVPSAADAVTPTKQKRLINAALSYMKMKRLVECPLRFDVVVIENAEIEWLKDAFGSTRYTY